MKRWLPVVLLVGLPLAGCGDDATPDRPAEVASLAPATDLGTPLPSGWPAVALPEGSTVLDTNADQGRLAVDFETQELAAPVAAFLDKELLAAGFEKDRSSSEAETTTITYASGPQTAVVTLVETAGTTSGTIRITRPASPSAKASPSSAS